MSVNELAGLLAAIALCVLVALAAVPLIKAGRALDEVRIAVRDLGHNSVPVLVELKSTVENTNAELEKMSLVTDDVALSPGTPPWSASTPPICRSCSRPPWAAPWFAAQRSSMVCGPL